MKSTILILFALLLSINVAATTSIETVATNVQVMVDSAKGAELLPQARSIILLIRGKRFAEAEQKSAALQLEYEKLFDKDLKQYAFQSRAEYEEYLQKSMEKFEWIDWGYQQCLQMQAFTAVERKDFSRALEFLKKIETIAPVSSGAAIEAGYILNQIKQPNDALASYQRAYDLSVRYVSQRPYQAMALRGIGFSLIELKRLTEAEHAFQKSLEIEPGNKVALHELAYIRDLRGSAASPTKAADPASPAVGKR